MKSASHSKCITSLSLAQHSNVSEYTTRFCIVFYSRTYFFPFPSQNNCIEKNAIEMFFFHHCCIYTCKPILCFLFVLKLISFELRKHTFDGISSFCNRVKLEYHLRNDKQREKKIFIKYTRAHFKKMLQLLQ